MDSRVETDDREVLTLEEWHARGRELAHQRLAIRGSSSRHMWEVGDWLLAGEDQLFIYRTRRYARQLAANLSGYSHHTLTMAVSVSRKFGSSRRIDGLSWWHHLAVAKLEPHDQTSWLTRAAEEEWSVTRLRAELSAARAVSRRPSSRRPLRLVVELVHLRRDDIPDQALQQLRNWIRAEGLLELSTADSV